MSLSPSQQNLLESLNSRMKKRLRETDFYLIRAWAHDQYRFQPVHTVYVSADSFSAWPGDDFIKDFSSSWTDHLPDRCVPALYGNAASDMTAQLEALAGELGIDDDVVADVVPVVVRKMLTNPIEDLRIDFEDGFTQHIVPKNQHGDDEDHRAVMAAHWLASVISEYPLEDEDADPHSPTMRPAVGGIRIKSLRSGCRERSLRTLIIFLDTLNELDVFRVLYDPESKSYNPSALRITLPKVTSTDQVDAFVQVLSECEQRYGFKDSFDKIRFDIEIEAPEAVITPGDGPDQLFTAGSTAPTQLISATDNRCVVVHHNTYNYLSALGIDLAEQSKDHPASDYALNILQVSTAATKVQLCDGGARTVPHEDPELHLAECREQFRLITRSLHRGFYQGWDLFPYQLPIRHLATCVYYRHDWREKAERVRHYSEDNCSRWIDGSETVRSLALFLLRANACGAISTNELLECGVFLGTLSILVDPSSRTA